MKKPKIVELSDVLNDPLLGKSVVIEGIIVKEYNRGKIKENKDFSEKIITLTTAGWDEASLYGEVK